MRRFVATAITLFAASLPLQATEYFGSELFTSGFSDSNTMQFEPSYVVSIGDSINISLYGAVNATEKLFVDPNGNISSQHFPPIQVAGVAYQDLNDTIQKALSQRYKNTVHMYSYLDATTPVRVTVSGAVMQPGTYSGVNSDNPLVFLTQAGGVNQQRGTIREINHIRHGKVIETYNLHHYMHTGRIQRVQFHQGDVLHVANKQGYISISGDASFTGQLDISNDFTGEKLQQLISLNAGVTHFRVQRLNADEKITHYLPIDELKQYTIQSGDNIELITDVKVTDVSVRVLGEHDSGFEHTFKHGATLEELVSNIEKSSLSSEDIQLFRRSVKAKQKERLNTQLDQLQRTALTTPSDTESTALLRKTEAMMMQQWIDAARKAEPKGQVIIPRGTDISNIILEDGDVVVIPGKDGIVQVNGDVVFPNAFAFDDKARVSDYIEMTGGLTNEDARIMVLSRSGEAHFAKMNTTIKRGDEIFVLPEVDEKEFQFAKDMTQILYQVAASAAIILGV